jgi:hypothetical protein
VFFLRQRKFINPVPHRASERRALQFLQTRSQIWQHWHQISSLRRREFSDPFPAREHESRPLQFPSDRPEELVWRRVLPTPTNSVENRPGLELSESSSRPQVRSPPSHESALGMTPVHERAAATQITRLDPAVLDRLADDVIRRVEKRVRIERQRRGL